MPLFSKKHSLDSSKVITHYQEYIQAQCDNAQSLQFVLIFKNYCNLIPFLILLESNITFTLFESSSVTQMNNIS